MILPSILSGSNCLRLQILLKVNLLEENCIKLLWSFTLVNFRLVCDWFCKQLPHDQ